MPGDYYEDASAPPDQTTADKGMEEGKDDAGEDKGEATALLPKSVLGGKEFKAGEEVVLKVVHVYEDEVEVEYATEKGGGMEGDSGEMMEAQRGMDSLAV